MHRQIRVGRLVLLLALFATAPAVLHAQSLKDRLKAKAKERADSQVEQAMDKVLDQIENAAKCVVGDAECVANAKKSGQKVVLTDDQGAVLPPAQQPAGSPAKNAEAVAAVNAKNGVETPTDAKASEPTEAAAPAAAAKPVVWANYDFIPGERVLFADDFTNDRVGNFPQRLELVSGNAEIVEVDGKRFLRASSVTRFYINLPEALPQRFTFEFDLAIPWNGMMVFGGPDGSGDPLDETLTHSFVKISGTDAGIMGGTGAKSVVDPRSATGIASEDINGHMFRIRVHGDGKYLKVYMDERRIANIPNANFNHTNRLVFDVWADGDTPEAHNTTLIGNITVNAGGRDMYDALMSDGRVVTQGIFFDVGSDRIRPESTPTMKIIGDMLKSHADLKLMVEGHTDNTGNAASNQTLSQKRAQAIVAYLTGQFGIDAARLQAKGYGATKPAKPNDTPEGRQSNRRVELVKI
jgi:OOP family OmpA-OmpF porin